jgi:hypothetical protein
MTLDIFGGQPGQLLSLAELARKLAERTGRPHTAEILKGWAKPLAAEPERPRLAVVLIGTVWHSTEAAVQDYLERATAWRLGRRSSAPAEDQAGPPPSKASARAAAELERAWEAKPRGRKRRKAVCP